MTNTPNRGEKEGSSKVVSGWLWNNSGVCDPHDETNDRVHTSRGSDLTAQEKASDREIQRRRDRKMADPQKDKNFFAKLQFWKTIDSETSSSSSKYVIQIVAHHNTDNKRRKSNINQDKITTIAILRSVDFCTCGYRKYANNSSSSNGNDNKNTYMRLIHHTYSDAQKSPADGDGSDERGKRKRRTLKFLMKSLKILKYNAVYHFVRMILC